MQPDRISRRHLTNVKSREPDIVELPIDLYRELMQFLYKFSYGRVFELIQHLNAHSTFINTVDQARERVAAADNDQLQTFYNSVVGTVEDNHSLGMESAEFHQRVGREVVAIVDRFLHNDEPFDETNEGDA